MAVICALSCLAFAAQAGAAYDPLGGGQTKLVLDKGFASFLKHDGVTLAAKAGARKQGFTYLLGVSGGALDPTTGKGEIDNQGSLLFGAGPRQIPFRGITVKTKHSPLIAKVGGSQLKVATSSGLSFTREGFASCFTARALKLSEKAATRLNKKLRPEVRFSQGQLLGTLIAKAQPRLVTIKEADRATLSFDAAFLAKLESLFVSVNPIHPAEHLGADYTFPIVIGGAIAPDGAEGTLRTGGAVELLQLGAGQLFWQEFWLDLGAHAESAEADLEPTPAFPGKVGRSAIFAVAGGSVASDAKGRTISASGIGLTLTPASAAQLNTSFAGGKEAFRAGEAAGVLSFAAVGQ